MLNMALFYEFILSKGIIQKHICPHRSLLINKRALEILQYASSETDVGF